MGTPGRGRTSASVLTSLQQSILEALAPTLRGSRFALAGGAALISSGVVERTTMDLDLFTTSVEELPETASRVETALSADGMKVTRTRDSGTFIRFLVERSGARCIVDLAVDTRIRPPRPGTIPILDEEELGADKVLALFDRASARDFVDVFHLARRLGPDHLLSLASEKDPGFDLTLFAAALDALDPEELALVAGDDASRIAAWSRRWKDTLAAT